MFEILERAKPVDRLPDWLHDLCDGEADEIKMSRYAYHLISEIKEAKQGRTVRKRLMFNWWFLNDLAEMHPTVFDEILAAAAERSAEVRE